MLRLEEVDHESHESPRITELRHGMVSPVTLQGSLPESPPIRQIRSIRGAPFRHSC
jgi:hypothetical protein